MICTELSYTRCVFHGKAFMTHKALHHTKTLCWVVLKGHVQCSASWFISRIKSTTEIHGCKVDYTYSPVRHWSLHGSPVPPVVWIPSFQV